MGGFIRPYHYLTESSVPIAFMVESMLVESTNVLGVSINSVSGDPQDAMIVVTITASAKIYIFFILQ
jgi:hypothetical protein